MFKRMTNILAGITITIVMVNMSFAEDVIQTSENKIPSSLIHVVSSNSMANTMVLGGSVIPWKMVNLSAQMPGAVQYIAGQEGDAFTKGSALVSLNTASLLAKREQAMAQYNSANAGYGNAVVQYQREVRSPNSQANSMLAGLPSMLTVFSDPMREMSGQGDPDYERHSSLYGQSVQIETAKNQVKQARAGILELDENLKNAVSVAPFDGVIVKKMIEVGDIIQPGMPLVVFADLSKMQVQVEVPTKLVSSLKEGGKISVQLSDGKKINDATISRIFPMANMGGHTTTVKVSLPDGVKATPGMYAEVLIPNKSSVNKPRATIPKSAISWRGSLPAVFLVTNEDTSLKMKTLRLGKTDGDNVAILSGLKVGEKILIKPLVTTRSGPYQQIAK